MGKLDIQPVAEDARTRVFLSYSRKDTALVQRVADGLMAAGFLADFDRAAHDPGNVSAGISAEDEWWKRLQEMIAAADVMVFLVSPDSAASAVCDEEIAYARALGKRIIAVLTRPVDFAKAPPRLSALNVRIDFSEGGPGFDAALAGLVAALETNVGWHRDGRKYLIRVQEWDTEGRPKSQLLREGAVEEAERWAVTRPRGEPEPGELFLAWIAASRAQIRRDAAVRGFWRRVTAIFVLTTLAATLAGAWFVVNGQRNLSRSESLMLARTSDQFLSRGDYLRALHLAILASRDTFLQPSTDEAKAAFARSAQGLTQVAAIQPEDVFVDASVSKDGRYIATWDSSARISLWQTDPAKEISRRVHPPSGFGFVGGGFSPDGKRFLSFSLQAVHLQDTATGNDIGEPIVLQNAIRFAKMSPDGMRFLTLDWDDGSAHLFDAMTAKVIGGPLSLVGETSGAVFSDDSALVLSWGAPGGQLWSARTGEPVGALLATPGAAHDAAMSSDARYAAIWYTVEAAGDVTSAVRLFDLETGAGHDLSVSGDGRVYFVEGTDRFVIYDATPSLRIWSASTGEPVSGAITTTALDAKPPLISAKADRLVTFSYLTGARLVSLSTGEEIDEAPALRSAISGATFTPDGQLLLVWTGQSAIRINPVDGAELGMPIVHGSEIRDIVISPDSRLAIVVGSAESRVYDLVTGTALGAPLQQGQGLTNPEFIDGGKRVVTYASSKAVISLTGQHTANEGVRQQTSRGEASYERDAEMTPDGKVVILRQPEGAVEFWNAAARRRVAGPVRLPSEIAYQDWAALSTDGNFVALRSDREAQVFETATGKAAGPARESAYGFTQVAVTPGGRRLIVQYGDGEVEIWDEKGDNPLSASMSLMHEQQAPLVVSPAGDRMVIWEGETAQIVSLVDGKAVGAPLGHSVIGAQPGYLTGAQFSVDGTRVLTFSFNVVKLWDSASGAPIGLALTPWNGVKFAALSPDGRRIYVGSAAYGSVHDSDTGAAIGPPHNLEFEVEGAVFSGDNQTVAAWSGGGPLQLREVATGKLLGEPLSTYSSVDGARFSPGGGRLMVWDQIGNVIIADRQTGASLAAFSHEESYAEPIWSEDGRTVRTLGTNGVVRVWDVDFAMRMEAARADVAMVCAAKLKSSTDAGGVPFVRRLDDGAIEAAPILRGREEEDVCTLRPVAWWETAAGALFGWAFR